MASNTNYLMVFKTDRPSTGRKLWKIWNKFHDGSLRGDLYYAVQLDGSDEIQNVLASDLLNGYPGYLKLWEEKFGPSWDANPSVVVIDKRNFNPTPTKDKQTGLKKSQSTGALQSPSVPMQGGQFSKPSIPSTPVAMGPPALSQLSGSNVPISMGVPKAMGSAMPSRSNTPVPSGQSAASKAAPSHSSKPQATGRKIPSRPNVPTPPGHSTASNLSRSALPSTPRRQAPPRGDSEEDLYGASPPRVPSQRGQYAIAPSAIAQPANSIPPPNWSKTLPVPPSAPSTKGFLNKSTRRVLQTPKASRISAAPPSPAPLLGAGFLYRPMRRMVQTPRTARTSAPTVPATPMYNSVLTPRASSLLFPKAVSAAQGMALVLQDIQDEIENGQLKVKGGDQDGQDNDTTDDSASDDDMSSKPRPAHHITPPATQGSQPITTAPATTPPTGPQTVISSAAPASQYDEYSKNLIDAWEVDIETLVHTAMDFTGMPDDKWPTSRKNSTKCSYEDFVTYLVMMVAGMHPLIREHVVKGTLPKEYHRNADLKKALDRLMQQIEGKSKIPTPMTKQSTCPSIYIHYFADQSGVGPTDTIVAAMLKDVEEYVREFGKQKVSKLAFDIDAARNGRWTTAKADSGVRRFCSIQRHKDTLLEFVAETRKRMVSVNGPMERTFTEVGYALKPIARLYQHAHHTSSNYIMNLMESIAMKNKQGYRNRQYVILHCVHPVHSMFGEILLSRIALAYTTQGGGFSHFQAGVSVGSSMGDKVQAELYAKRAFELAPHLEKEMKEQVTIKKGAVPTFEKVYAVLGESFTAGRKIANAEAKEDDLTTPIEEVEEGLKKYVIVA